MSSEVDILRLEKQNEQKNYNLRDELSFFHFEKNDLVLDAGCGSGLVTRALANEFREKQLRFEACDYSDIAVLNAEKYFRLDGVKARTFTSSIDDLKIKNNRYDKVICRYVLEHMKNPYDAAMEFFRVLKPGGSAYIIDLDGIVFNIHTENKVLNEFLSQLKMNFKFDLFVGRKIPSLLTKAGFIDISWDAKTMCFNTETERKMELANYESRFDLAKKIITDILGTQKKYEIFKTLYLEELAKNENVLFYTKFCVKGIASKNILIKSQN